MAASNTSVVKSNLEGLLDSLTPVVASKSIPQNCMDALNRVWNPIGKPISAYFRLGDLWDCYEKWSSCGAETKVQLNNGSTVVQYFVPHLSALQIFTNKSLASIRGRREDSDGLEVESEFWSDESMGDKLSRSTSNNSSKSDASSGDSNIENEYLPPKRDCLGNLYFKFHELYSPYLRIPLMDKINELAEEHPGLFTLKSTDLSPASWMAVSWYPIYHIPAKEPVEDLSTAFLTFHTLSSFFQDDDVDVPSEGDCKSNAENCCESGSKSISLPPFGLATYKLKGDVWLNHGAFDYVRLFDLHQAAESWLKQLNFEHHDFNFFRNEK